MAYTKEIGRSDRITIDGTDVSNAFNNFSSTNTDEEVDVTGFSATGNKETLQGARDQGFTGTWFYTPESYAILAPLYFNRTTFVIEWQPDGLVDSAREVYYGNCKILEFNPEATVGAVRTSPFTAKAADAAGIVVAAGT